MSILIRGNTARWTIPLEAKAGGPLDLRGCTVTVTYKSSTAVPDSLALFQHFIEVDITGVVTATSGMKLGPDGAAGGVVIERLSPLQSVGFLAGDYLYDLQVVIPNPDDAMDPDVYTPIIGDKDTVVLDITNTVDVTP